MELPIINVEKRSDGKLLSLLYSCRPDDDIMNIQTKINKEKIATEEKISKDIADISRDSWWPTTTNDVDKVNSESWWPIATKDVEENDFESWWPTTSNDIKENDSESWWPTNPIVIDSLEAKPPSKIGIIDWLFLDNEYHDLHDNKETQIEEISSDNGLFGKLPLIHIASLPRFSTSNINETQINMLKSARESDIEVQKVSSQRGSLSMIEMIKEMTMYLYYITKLF